MAVSTVMLALAESIAWTSVSLFLLGLGWNLSYIAATAELVTTRRRSSAAARRLHRSRRGLLAAALALIGGLAYTEWGVVAVAVGATLAVVVPAPRSSWPRAAARDRPEPAA